MARNAKKLVAVVASAAIVLALALAILTLRGFGSALPNANGYDDFVRAGQMATTTLDGHGDLGDYRELSLESLRAFAATNAEALKIARGGLQRQCRVPVENNRVWFRAHLGEKLSLYDLMRVVCVSGRLAEWEGRTNDAVNLYLDLIRFGHETSRGGMIVDNSTARTWEAIAMVSLKRMLNSLDVEQNRRIASVLEDLDARQESWGDISKREVRYTLLAEFTTLLSRDHWQRQQRFKARFYGAERQRRQAMLGFAARAYELETGAKPKSATDLVPAYLKAIPQDPLARTNLALTP